MNMTGIGVSNVTHIIVAGSIIRPLIKEHMG